METRTFRLECLQLLARPLVRFCLRNAYSFQDFINVCKVAYVREATAEIVRGGNKVNVSRLSALTGMYREDVARIYRAKDIDFGESISVLSRVLGQWEQDQRFLGKTGKPRALSCSGEGSEFYNLVYSVSKHLNPGTILFELERMGAAQRVGSKIRRTRQLARPNVDLRKGYELAASDIETLINAAEINLSASTSISNLHIRTEYDNIFVKDLPYIRRWIINEGKVFHRRIRDFLSNYDKDISMTHNDTAPAGSRVVVVAMSLATEPDHHQNNRPDKQKKRQKEAAE